MGEPRKLWTKERIMGEPKECSGRPAVDMLFVRVPRCRFGLRFLYREFQWMDRIEYSVAPRSDDCTVLNCKLNEHVTVRVIPRYIWQMR